MEIGAGLPGLGGSPPSPLSFPHPTLTTWALSLVHFSPSLEGSPFFPIWPLGLQGNCLSSSGLGPRQVHWRGQTPYERPRRTHAPTQAGPPELSSLSGMGQPPSVTVGNERAGEALGRSPEMTGCSSGSSSQALQAPWVGSPDGSAGLRTLEPLFFICSSLNVLQSSSVPRVPPQLPSSHSPPTVLPSKLSRLNYLYLVVSFH